MRVVKKFNNFLSKCVPNDIARTSGQLRGAVKNGWNKGKQRAALDNKGLLGDAYERSKGVAKEVKNLSFSWEDTPAIAAAVTSVLPIPIPGLFLGVYVLGAALRSAVHLVGKLRH